jgi:WD repeat-containing protein 42A
MDTSPPNESTLTQISDTASSNGLSRDDTVDEDGDSEMIPEPLEIIPDDSDEEEDSDEDDQYLGAEDLGQFNLPIIYPRARYFGHCNIETVKDVNFLGHSDEYVVSGSDDGLWFMWSKSTSKLEGIWEGDGSVVNVIECHPFLPIVAVSGIDSTVKLFQPTTQRPLAFSKLASSADIIETNSRAAVRMPIRLSDILQYRLANLSPGELGEGRNCPVM